MKLHTLVLTAAVVAAFAGSARADFSGTWTGTGHAHDEQAWKTECEKIEIVIAQTSIEFTVIRIATQCGAMGISQDSPMNLRIVEGRLMAETQKVGSIDDKTAHIEFTDASGALYWWSLQLNSDGTLNYSDHSDWSGGHSLETQGTLAHILR
jgi:hypothetical protein